MKDVAQALAELHLSSSGTRDCFVSPRSTAPRHQSGTLPASHHISLFPDLHRASAKQLQTATYYEASWSAIVGDLFQAVVERLPAHTAQHAMLVCRQWHDCVTNGLVCLRPRALRLNCISSRSVITMLHNLLQLHCTALHCTALHCTALHCTALHTLHERSLSAAYSAQLPSHSIWLPLLILLNTDHYLPCKVLSTHQPKAL